MAVGLVEVRGVWDTLGEHFVKCCAVGGGGVVDVGGGLQGWGDWSMCVFILGGG